MNPNTLQFKTIAVAIDLTESGLSGAALCASDGPHVRLDTGAGACHRPPRLRIPEWSTFSAQCE